MVMEMFPLPCTRHVPLPCLQGRVGVGSLLICFCAASGNPLPASPCPQGEEQRASCAGEGEVLPLLCMHA